MKYKKYPVKIEFDRFVECYFHWEGVTETEISIETSPNAYCSIVFNYKAPYSVSNDKYEKRQVPQAFVTGQSVRNYTLHLSGEIGMVGIVFKPAALYHCFGVSMYQLTEERVPLATLIGNESQFFEEIIQSCRTVEERITLLTQFLDLLFSKPGHATDQIIEASNLILEQKGNVHITDLLKNIYMSRRQFERKFLNEVGVSPKVYARLRRFGYTCSLMAGKRKVNLTKVLFEGGYYDQSHFIKDFKYFSNRTPKFYVENNRELAHFIQKHELI